jgi:hypothetical protein
MRKLFFVLFCFAPALGFAAVDVSDCEVIGHQKGGMTEKDCNTVESCNVDFARFPEDLQICLKHAKTPEQCKTYIAEQNAKIEQENLVYRCPLNAWLVKQRDKEKDHTVHNLVYTNGFDIDQKALENDASHVYLFHGNAGLMGFVNKKKYSIIGPAGKYGLNMALVDEE